MTYKDELENRKNARKHAQHQNQQEQPARLASRKKDLLAHLEENIRDLGVTIETDDQTGTIGLKHAAGRQIKKYSLHCVEYPTDGLVKLLARPRWGGVQYGGFAPT